MAKKVALKKATSSKKARKFSGKGLLVSVLKPGEAAVDLANSNITIKGKPIVKIVNKVTQIDFEIKVSILPDDKNTGTSDKPLATGTDYSVFYAGTSSLTPDINQFKVFFGALGTTIQMTDFLLDIPADKGNNGN